MRTRRTHSHLLLREIADAMKGLSGERESAAARAYVENMLQCPFWGLRVLAIRAFGAWGGRRNKAWLKERAGRRTTHRHHPASRDERWLNVETYAAREALRPLLTGGDADFVLEAWFEDEGWNFSYALSIGLASIPQAVLVPRLEEEIAGGDAGRRTAALRLVAEMANSPERARLIARLLTDDDADVRDYARVLSLPRPDVREMERTEEPRAPNAAGSNERSRLGAGYRWPKHGA